MGYNNFMNTQIILLALILNFVTAYTSLRLIMRKNRKIKELEEQLIKEVSNLQDINFNLMNTLVNNIFMRINISVMSGEIDEEAGIYLIDLLSPLAMFFVEEMHISYMLYEYKDDSKEYDNVARQALLDAAQKFSEKKGLVNDN